MDWIHGLGLAATGRHESAAIGGALIQRRSGGLESEAGRRALSQRRAGGLGGAAPREPESQRAAWDKPQPAADAHSREDTGTRRRGRKLK